MTWRLKGCPRCGGDTFIDNDVDGWHEHCLMCGHTRDLPAVVIARPDEVGRGAPSTTSEVGARSQYESR